MFPFSPIFYSLYFYDIIDRLICPFYVTFYSPSFFLSQAAPQVKRDRDQGSISPACLGAAFTHSDPKSAKKQSSDQCLLALLGSSLVKAACKMLVK